MTKPEIFISVDVETSGPVPGEYSLLSIGACETAKPESTFYCCLKPTAERVDLEALAASGHSIDQLSETGMDAVQAMSNFRSWVDSVSGDATPIFVGLNAPFDWAFVNYYFHRYCGTNPFGHSALDIKALFLGRFGGRWGRTKSSRMMELLQPRRRPDHHALRDAQFQAELFELIRAQSPA